VQTITTFRNPLADPGLKTADIWKFGCLQKHGYFHLELCLKLWTRKISPRRVKSRSCCQQNSSTVELVDHTHTQSYVQFSYKHVAVTWGPTGTQRHADNTFYQIRCGSGQFFATISLLVFAAVNMKTCFQPLLDNLFDLGRLTTQAYRSAGLLCEYLSACGALISLDYPMTRLYEMC